MFRRLTFGLLGAAALAASVFVIRAQRQPRPDELDVVPPGEDVPGQIRLDRLRELGI
ncbi:MAG: hypothetical protein R3E98_13175 [Gemmatimonadota bacterium]|nr:hypothetical protein [Gemmatimonadota bacterium]